MDHEMPNSRRGYPASCFDNRGLDETTKRRKSLKTIFFDKVPMHMEIPDRERFFQMEALRSCNPGVILSGKNRIPLFGTLPVLSKYSATPIETAQRAAIMRNQTVRCNLGGCGKTWSPERTKTFGCAVVTRDRAQEAQA